MTNSAPKYVLAKSMWAGTLDDRTKWCYKLKTHFNVPLETAQSCDDPKAVYQRLDKAGADRHIADILTDAIKAPWLYFPYADKQQVAFEALLETTDPLMREYMLNRGLRLQNVAFAQYLVSRGVRPNWLSLLQAIRAGSIEGVKLILSQKPNQYLLPLMWRQVMVTRNVPFILAMLEAYYLPGVPKIDRQIVKQSEFPGNQALIEFLLQEPRYAALVSQGDEVTQIVVAEQSLPSLIEVVAAAHQLSQALQYEWLVNDDVDTLRQYPDAFKDTHEDLLYMALAFGSMQVLEYIHQQVHPLTLDYFQVFCGKVADMDHAAAHFYTDEYLYHVLQLLGVDVESLRPQDENFLRVLELSEQLKCASIQRLLQRRASGKSNDSDEFDFDDIDFAEFDESRMVHLVAQPFDKKLLLRIVSVLEEVLFEDELLDAEQMVDVEFTLHAYVQEHAAEIDEYTGQQLLQWAISQRATQLVGFVLDTLALKPSLQNMASLRELQKEVGVFESAAMLAQTVAA